MTDPWRVLQIFMGSAEDRVQVYEVSFLVGQTPKQFRCTCQGWRMRHRCVHVDYVIERTADCGGYAPPLATPTAREALTPAVMDDPEQFRAWIYKNIFPVVVL